MSLELEEDVPTTEEEDDEESNKKSSGKTNKSKKKSKKKNQPGRYSQLVVDTIRKLGERNGSSLAKIYSEAKKVSWFDQQNGRTYLKYSVKALVQNYTLVQVKGVGANGSFRLNKKLEGGTPEKKAAPAPKPVAKKSAPKKSPKKVKAKPKPKKEKPKKSAPKATANSAKKKAPTSGGKKAKKGGKSSRTKTRKS